MTSLSAWINHPSVRDFYRDCCEASIAYLYGPHEAARTTKVERIDDPRRKIETARHFANAHGVPDEAVLRAAMSGTLCAGHRLRVVTARRRSMHRGWVCSNGTTRKFRSCPEAAKWVGGHESNVRSAVLGYTATAYGLRWWREIDGTPVIPAAHRPRLQPVRVFDHEYPSIKRAVACLGMTRRMIETRAERLRVA
jgi:hypothetical protein